MSLGYIGGGVEADFDNGQDVDAAAPARHCSSYYSQPSLVMAPTATFEKKGNIILDLKRKVILSSNQSRACCGHCCCDWHQLSPSSASYCHKWPVRSRETPLRKTKTGNDQLSMKYSLLVADSLHVTSANFDYRVSNLQKEPASQTLYMDHLQRAVIKYHH